MFRKVDLLRSQKTIKEHINNLKRYTKAMGSLIDSAKIREFLFYVRNKYPNPRTYRSYLCTLRVFCRDFLKHGDWVQSLKLPRIKPNIITDLPTKKQLRNVFYALPHDKAKVAFLTYCSSGLRASEIFDAKIMKEIRAIIPVVHEQYSTKIVMFHSITLKLRYTSRKLISILVTVKRQYVDGSKLQEQLAS